jgi:hypothetical protein
LSLFSATIVQISSNLRNDWDLATPGCIIPCDLASGVREWAGIALKTARFAGTPVSAGYFIVAPRTVWLSKARHRA